MLQVCSCGRTTTGDMVTQDSEECSPSGMGAFLALTSTWPTSPRMAWSEPAKPWLHVQSSMAEGLGTGQWSRATGPHDLNAAGPSVHCHHHHRRSQGPKRHSVSVRRARGKSLVSIDKE